MVIPFSWRDGLYEFEDDGDGRHQRIYRLSGKGRRVHVMTGQFGLSFDEKEIRIMCASLMDAFHQGRDKGFDAGLKEAGEKLRDIMEGRG
jgi:hypothetical protein